MYIFVKYFLLIFMFLCSIKIFVKTQIEMLIRGLNLNVNRLVTVNMNVFCKTT